MPSPLAVLIAVHVALAIMLLVPSLALPFALRWGRPVSQSRSVVVRGLLRLQDRGTPVVGGGLAISGVGVLLILGGDLLGRPWLVLALAVYAANLALAFFVQRPSLRHLVGLRSAWDDTVWQTRARRQRYVSYAMAGLTGAIGFLMTAKPELW